MKRTGNALCCTMALLWGAGTMAADSLFTDDAVRNGKSPDDNYCIVLDMPRVQATNEWLYLVGSIDDQGLVTGIVDSVRTAAHLSWCDDHTLFRIEHSSGNPDRGAGPDGCTHLITVDVETSQVDTVASLCHDGAGEAYGSFNKQAFRLRDSVFCFQTYRADHRWLSVVARIAPDGRLDTLQTYVNAGMPVFCTGFNNIAVGVRPDRAAWSEQQGIAVLDPASGKERYRAAHEQLSLVEPVIRRNDGRLYCRAVDSRGRSHGIVRYDNRRFRMDMIWKNNDATPIEHWYLDGDSLRIYLDASIDSGAATGTRQTVAVKLD